VVTDDDAGDHAIRVEIILATSEARYATMAEEKIGGKKGRGRKVD